jgi:hypothetical protein
MPVALFASTNPECTGPVIVFSKWLMMYILPSFALVNSKCTCKHFHQAMVEALHLVDNAPNVGNGEASEDIESVIGSSETLLESLAGAVWPSIPSTPLVRLGLQPGPVFCLTLGSTLLSARSSCYPCISQTER